MAGERILPQHALNEHGEPVDALAHIYIAEGQVNFHAWWKQGHDTAPSAAGPAQERVRASVMNPVLAIRSAIEGKADIDVADFNFSF
jgi:hypothetical protein